MSIATDTVKILYVDDSTIVNRSISVDLVSDYTDIKNKISV